MSLNLCSIFGSNTGGVDCDVVPGRPKKISVGGASFTSSQYADSATFQAAFIAAHKLDNGNAGKLFAFPEIGKVDINTQASTSGNLPFGPNRQLVKGIPAYTYTVEIGITQYQALLPFHKKIVPVFTLDDASNEWGYRAGVAANTTNTNNFTGQRAYITVEGLGFQDGTNVESGLCKIGVAYQNVDDFEKRAAYMPVPDMASSDLVGLKGILLSEFAAHVSNVYKIKMTIPLPKIGGDLNIYDDYGVLIQPLTWTAFTGASFTTPLTITSIAVDATNKVLTVTFDSTMYTALSAGAKIKLVGPTVAVLDAAGVTGIELGYIILTK